MIYVAQGTALGVRIVTVDPNENTLLRPPPEFVSIARTLRPQLRTLAAQFSADTRWFVSSLEQAGTRIDLVDETGTDLDGLTAWRLIRSLRPGPVTVVVTQRPAPPPDPPQTIQLDGWRRSYTDARTGAIDATYQPGELTQSLCSPWQHDFRDCSCTYWASNHPDIVFPAVPRGEPTQPGGLPTDPSEQIRINWLRDPDVAEVHGQALPSQRDNRPFEASYFQINQRWQDLSIVLEGRETEGSYVPRSAARDQAVPFPTNDELWDRIVELAGLEHLVTLLHLYALFSVIEPAQAQQRGAGRWPTLADDVTFTRSVLLEVATSEMQHLRWANHLLWGLAGAIGHPYQPAVVPPALALPAPPGGAPRPAQLAPLTLDTLALLVDIERSSAYIDGQYARVTATLRQPGYPAHLYQLASNIAEEGEEHFLHFRDLQLLLSPYGEQDPAHPDVGAALDAYRHHVDRAQLARECLRAARRRGAAALPVATIGRPVNLPRGEVEVRAGEAYLRAVAAVDATGRTARWSRPVARSGSEGATVYTGPGRARARPGRVARVREGWAYRLEHPQATTVGVVRRRGTGAAALDGTLAGDLGIDDPECFVRVGMCPAAVQWSRQPVAPGRLAVGDAALALNPVAGQGVRFVVLSALAAAVLRSWKDGSWRDGAAALASDYYRCFVDGVRSRHLAKLAVIAGERSGSAAPNEPLDTGRRLRWAARVERVGVNRGGQIVCRRVLRPTRRRACPLGRWHRPAALARRRHRWPDPCRDMRSARASRRR